MAGVELSGPRGRRITKEDEYDTGACASKVDGVWFVTGRGSQNTGRLSILKKYI